LRIKFRKTLACAEARQFFPGVVSVSFHINIVYRALSNVFRTLPMARHDLDPRSNGDLGEFVVYVIEPLPPWVNCFGFCFIQIADSKLALSS
jgi:hypothetical protein